jgi:hypothetical protein
VSATAFDLALLELAAVVERVAPSWRFNDMTVLTGDPSADQPTFQAPGGESWVNLTCASCGGLLPGEHDEECRDLHYVAGVFLPGGDVAFQSEIADLAILLPLIEDARRSGRLDALLDKYLAMPGDSVGGSS